MTAGTPGQALYEAIRDAFPEDDYVPWGGLDPDAQARYGQVASQQPQPAPGKQCGKCDGSGTLMVPDRSGESASEQACTDPVHDQAPAQPAPDARRALLDIIDEVGRLDEPGPAADYIHLLARYGLGDAPHPGDGTEPKPAPELQAVESAYLYHWRFDRGEEFGLYRHAADAGAKAAEHAGDGLSEVLSMAILGRPEPQPAPGLAEAIRAYCRQRAAEFSADMFPVRPQDMRVSAADILAIVDRAGG